VIVFSGTDFKRDRDCRLKKIITCGGILKSEELNPKKSENYFLRLPDFEAA